MCVSTPRMYLRSRYFLVSPKTRSPSLSSLIKLALLLLIEFAKITLLAALLDPFHYSVEWGNCQRAIERNLLPIIAFQPLLRLTRKWKENIGKFLSKKY